MKTFYNTTQLEGDEVEFAIKFVANQQRAILQFFAKNKGKNIAPHQVWEFMGKTAPLTSIRRAITNLTEDGLLIKNGKEDQVLGLYNMKTNTWKYNEGKSA